MLYFHGNNFSLSKQMYLKIIIELFRIAGSRNIYLQRYEMLDKY